MSDHFEVLWSGDRHVSLCADSFRSSSAKACADDLDAEPEPEVEVRPRTGRGYRPVGRRFRDAVLELLPAPCGDRPGARRSLAAVVASMEAFDKNDVAMIARALGQLAQEGRLSRQLQKLGPGRPRWVYWRR